MRGSRCAPEVIDQHKSSRYGLLLQGGRSSKPDLRKIVSNQPLMKKEVGVNMATGQQVLTYAP